MNFILALIIILFLIYYYYENKIKSKKNIKIEKEIEFEPEIEEFNNEYNYPYTKKFLLTKNEWYFYKQLKPITDKLNLHILSKIRMADLIDVQKGLSKKEYAIAFAKIKSKHLDFVLADPNNLEVKLVIELDDNTHNRQDRIERDKFVDKAFEKIGLSIIHVQNIQNIENLICEKLNINKALER